MVLILLSAALAWGALAFGGVYAWAWPPLLAMASLAGVTAWFTGDGPSPSQALAVAVAATTVAVAAQLIPLDRAAVAAISPGTDAILRQLNLAYAHGDSLVSPIRHPLSVAPALTATGLAFLTCAAAVTLGVSRWLTRDRLRQTAAIITSVGGIVAAIAIIQRATSPGVIYGFWQPFFGTEPFGPFVNKNHFAGWTSMALPVGIGLAAGLLVRNRRHRARDWRQRLLRLSSVEGTGVLLSAFAVMVMLIALLMSLSRSGIAATGAALLIANTLTMRRLGWAHQLGVIACVALMALVALRAVDTERLWYRFQSFGEATYASRLSMWRDTVRMVEDVPTVGVGIRAYTVASLLYQTGTREEHVGAAHNDWLQLVAEGGVLVSVPAAIVLLILTREAARRFREHRQSADRGTTYWIRAGSAAGLLAIGLQSLVDFSLQMPGNTILFAVLWAIVIAPLPQRSPDTRDGIMESRVAERGL